MSARIQSGLRLVYRIEYTDDSVGVYQSELSDVMRWEAAHRGEGWLTDGVPPVERLLWVAWCAGRRLGEIKPGPFEQWLLSVRDFDNQADDEGEADSGLDPTSQDLSV